MSKQGQGRLAILHVFLVELAKYKALVPEICSTVDGASNETITTVVVVVFLDASRNVDRPGGGSTG